MLASTIRRPISLQMARRPTGLTDSRTLGLSQEMRLWRELCIFHFENDQIFNVLKRGEDLSTIDWQELYKRLVKYGGVLYNCSFVQL